ncbi:MAG: glycosyltransferase [Planctomycetota bacterium]|nr:MAG: glycosyltransferase [Planctomycetota bacterium]
MKVALVTTAPSTVSEVGSCAHRLVPHLREHVEVETFVPPESAGEEIAGVPSRSVRELRPQAFDRILYALGNERAHAFMLPLIRRFGGTVALNDWVLHELAHAAHPALERGGARAFLAGLREGGLAEARALWAAPPGVPAIEGRVHLALNRSVVRLADAYLVPNGWMRRRILEERNAATPIGVVPRPMVPEWREADRRETRTRLGLPPAFVEGFLVVSVGDVSDHKRIDAVLRGIARAHKSDPTVHFLLGGDLRTQRLDVPGLVRELSLAGAVRTIGRAEGADMGDLIHAADVCVHLRGPSMGGASKGVHEALARGRGVLVSDLEENRELPEDCALRVPHGEAESAAVAAHLTALASDATRQSAQEAAARRFVSEECDPARVARRTVECLEHSPAHRTNRKSILRSAIEAADAARNRQS